MKRLETPKILVVGCQHGDEPFGAGLAQVVEHDPELSEKVDTVIANPLALRHGVRFVQTDMNRAFGPNSVDSYERQRALELFQRIAGYSYVVDLHTTTTELEGAIIAPDLFRPTQRAINAFDRGLVAVMPRKMSEVSLIGSRRGSAIGAISLEFNADYARTEEAHEEVLGGLRRLARGESREPISRDMLFVNGVIDNSTQLRTDVNYNLNLLPVLYGRSYGFLVNERGYTSHRGFRATHRTKMEI